MQEGRSFVPSRAVNLCRLILTSIMLLSSATFAQTYSPPPNHRADILLDANWRFIRQDVPGAQTTAFDDSAWTLLDLPHTWNNLDGQDGGPYYRGVGWHRTHYPIPTAYSGRHFFLKFDGAFSVSDVWVNGHLLGEHQGGFAAFVFDITPYVNVGADNVIAVKVNNATNTNCVFTWPVTLAPSLTNTVQAIGTKGSTNVTDSLIWIAPIAPPTAAITSPTGSIVYLNSTNDTLKLSATASNNPANATLPLTTIWTQSAAQQQSFSTTPLISPPPPISPATAFMASASPPIKPPSSTA
jgi:Glycosyl hydrolases family 2, sugar binding domain